MLEVVHPDVLLTSVIGGEDDPAAGVDGAGRHGCEVDPCSRIACRRGRAIGGRGVGPGIRNWCRPRPAGPRLRHQWSEGGMTTEAVTAVLVLVAFAVLVFLIIRTDRGGG